MEFFCDPSQGDSWQLAYTADCGVSPYSGQEEADVKVCDPFQITFGAPFIDAGTECCASGGIKVVISD